jgi:hypothetical protein
MPASRPGHAHHVPAHRNVEQRIERRAQGRPRSGGDDHARRPRGPLAATPDGKARYRQRAGVIEPVFAQLFTRPGTRLHDRGQRADLELHLRAATHNLLKAIRAHQRNTTQQATAQAA